MPMDQRCICGVNPVREAFAAGREMEKLLVLRRTGSALPLIAQAKERGVPVVDASERQLARLLGEGVNHQGVCAVLSEVRYHTMDELLAACEAAGEAALVVLLDGVEDPQNLGAIARTAEALGAQGMLIPKRHTAAIGGAAMRASAGALNHLPVVRVPNLTAALQELKAAGFWAVGAEMGCPDAARQNLKGKMALCLGGEDHGLGRLVKESCDLLVGIPMQGTTPSLNVSAAGAILLYEIVRQRRSG